MYRPNGSIVMKYSTKIFYYSTVLASLFCFVLMAQYTPIASGFETIYGGLAPTTLLGVAGTIIYPLRNMTNESPTGVIFSLSAYTFSLLIALAGLTHLDSVGVLEYVSVIDFMLRYFTYIPLLGLATCLFSYIFGWRNHGSSTAR